MISRIFQFIYAKSSRSRWWSIAALVALMAGMAFLSSRVEFEEDITKLIPNKEKNQDLERVLKNVSFTDKLIVNISLEPDGSIDDLTAYASQFLDSVQASSSEDIQRIQGRVHSDDLSGTIDFIYENLPLFLDENDYSYVEGQLSADSLSARNLANFKALVSPTGLVARKTIQRDPLGLSLKGLGKLRSISIGDDFILHDGFLVSKDQQHLVLFITPVHNSDQTADNFNFADALYRINKNLDEQFEGKANSEYFGSILIAVANAQRIKRDIRISVSIAILILLLLLIFFFRKVSVAIILFVPSVFGALLAISVLYFFRSHISAISLGIGSVMLGVTLDYALHILTHIRNRGSVAGLYSQVASPILVSSLTTACAFLCLLFLSSQALQDLGLFCAIAVLGASVFALIFIPLAYRPQQAIAQQRTFLDKVAAQPHHRKKYLIIPVGILLAISLFTYSNVIFNNDLAQMNYVPPHLEQAQLHLDELTSLATKSIYVVAYGTDQEEAMQASDAIHAQLSSLMDDGAILDYSSIGALINSSKGQGKHIERWNAFWTENRKETLKTGLIESGSEVGFKATTYKAFYEFLEKDFKALAVSDYEALDVIELSDFISSQDDFTTVTSLVNVDRSQLPRVRAAFKDVPHVMTIDRQQMKEAFLGDLKEDFNDLIFYSLGIVLLILLLYFKSFSLTLITAIPIMLTWLMTIGIMGIFGLQLNIFNIIICTFIFGLGIDYSIFVTRGLLMELKTGEGILSTYKTSILLSVITTLLGVGVLIFAKHPALYSISVVSIIGILSACLIAFTVQPWLFKLLVGSYDRPPVKIRVLFMSVTSFVYFGLGGLFLSFCSTFILPVIPTSKKVKMKYFHQLIAGFKKSVLYSNPFVKKRVHNPLGETFDEPAMLIANHTSFLDILAMGMLHPKIVFLVNDWVYTSPIFGKVVRLAGGYPVSSGLEEGIPHLQEKVRQGYSIMVFPEGTRSTSHVIKRFHRGAFYLAHELGLDVIPILIHGNSEVNPKGSFFIRDGNIDLKILPRIKPGSSADGDGHRDTAKETSRLFRSEFTAFRQELEPPEYFHPAVLAEYKYRDRGRYNELKGQLKGSAQEYSKLLRSIAPKATLAYLSENDGALLLLLTLDGPQRKLDAYIHDDAERAVITWSSVSRRYGNLQFRDEPMACLKEADVVLIVGDFKITGPVAELLKEKQIIKTKSTHAE